MATLISSNECFEPAFKPRTIAIVGASNDKGKIGYSDLKYLIESGYKGKIYPINPKEEMVQGYKAYRSVLDVPDSIDRAAIIVPIKFVPAVVKECAEKGVKVVQIYTSGFGEEGKEGKLLECHLLSIVRESGMRIIGPNCIGTYCPSGGISFTNSHSFIPGNIAFVSQSGGITVDIINRGEILGIHFSKVISVGNCIDLNSVDFLEFLADDDETKAIGMYIESVKDGKRLLDVLKKVTFKKPVVILKGGRTEAGNQSVASHTGSLAGSYEIWKALFKQTGVIAVESIDEMLIVLQSIQYIRPFKDGKLAMLGNGGGATVLATDYCEEINLKLASLSNESVAKLRDLGVAGLNRNSNPIDLPANDLIAENGQRFGRIVNILANDRNVGHIMFHLNLIPLSSYLDLASILRKITDEVSVVDQSKTNLVGVLRYNGHPKIENIRYEISQEMQAKGIAVFGSIEQAAFGLSIVANCMPSHGFREEENESVAD